MKVFLMLFFWALVLWPIISWMSYHVAGWGKWQKLFRRDVTNDTDLATSVGLKKFGSYNRCVRIGVEDYGIAFKPTFFLLFHKSFCIPWIQILSFQASIGKFSKVCILHTSQGDVRITGDAAEIVSRACESHYVSRIG
ncbi:hypothetical protein KA057_01565 [Candidatus Gracilibacteria bacterium]|nr:hypothetical protein [Candidatus Gracilibacteria bacterium]